MKTQNRKPSGYECIILDSNDNEINFIVNGNYKQSFDRETGCTEVESEVTEIWIDVENGGYVLLPLDILDDTVIEDLESQFCDKYKSNQPSKQNIKDDAGDEKYHLLADEGII